MANSETHYLEESVGIKPVLLLLFNILVFCGIIFVTIVFVGGNFIDNYHKVQNQASYLSVSKWSIPAFIYVLSAPAFLYILILRLCKRLTQKGLDNAMKCIIVVTVIFLISRLIYGFALTSYLENNGYRYCYYYSSSSVMGNNTWLKDSNYCMKNIAAHRNDIEAWFDQEEATEKSLTLEYVQQGILKLDKAERALRPGAYN